MTLPRRLLKRFSLAWLLLLLPALAAASPEAEQIGRRVAAALNAHDAQALVELIDTESLGRAIVTDMGLTSSQAQGFERGLSAGMRQSWEAGVGLFAKRKGVAKYVRAGSRDGRPFALVRIAYTDDEAGFDYLELYLSPSQRLSDWYMHSRASLASAAVKVLAAAVLKNDSILASIFGIKAFSQGDIANVRQFSAQFRAGDFANAYRTLELLPASYRRTRDWAMLRVATAGHDDRAYRAALEHLARNFGDDKPVQFMLIDHYFLQQKFDLALNTIAAFEGTIGGEDGATNYLKCSCLIAWERYDDAVKACRRGIEVEPDFKSAYWGVVSAGLASRNPALALAGLSAYEKAFDARFDPDRLAQLDEYRELARTAEFAAWAKPRRGAAK